MDRKGILLILIYCVSCSSPFRYEFLLEDEYMYSPCDNGPPGAVNISGLVDLSNMTFTMTEKGIYIEGNLTTVWNIRPTDRVSAEISVSYFDRGSWIPTILNMFPKDLCPLLYDEKQFWYNMWFKHVINTQEVKDKCLNVPGTVLVFEPFTVEAILGLDVPIRPGRHKIIIIATAFDLNGVKSGDTICFQLRGEMTKL